MLYKVEVIAQRECSSVSKRTHVTLDTNFEGIEEDVAFELSKERLRFVRLLRAMPVDRPAYASADPIDVEAVAEARRKYMLKLKAKQRRIARARASLPTTATPPPPVEVDQGEQEEEEFSPPVQDDGLEIAELESRSTEQVRDENLSQIEQVLLFLSEGMDGTSDASRDQRAISEFVMRMVAAFMRFDSGMADYREMGYRLEGLYGKPQRRSDVGAGRWSELVMTLIRVLDMELQSLQGQADHVLMVQLLEHIRRTMNAVLDRDHLLSSFTHTATKPKSMRVQAEDGAFTAKLIDTRDSTGEKLIGSFKSECLATAIGYIVMNHARTLNLQLNYTSEK